MKKILILGGTQFIGRNLVERLLELEQYEITLFNRQLTQANLFSQTQKIKGDRETDDVKQIATKHWDYVIDLSCYYPESLKKVLKTLKYIDKYILISSCSVYNNENNKTSLRDEQSEILSCSSEQKVDRGTATYGNRKAECERLLQNSGFPFIILRPALVFGRYDHTDRLYYWLYQVNHNSTLLLPDNGERIFSITYVSDLVETIIQALTINKIADVYNVISTPKASIRKIVDRAGELLNREFDTINAPPNFLKANNISEWVNMPLWLDADHFTYCSQKLEDQMKVEITDFQKSIASTVHYYNTLNWPQPKYGMAEKSRRELLKKLQSTKPFNQFN